MISSKRLLGMVEVSGYPDPYELADSYVIEVKSYGSEKATPVRFAFVRNGRAYIPAVSISPKKLPYPAPKRVKDFSGILNDLRAYQVTAFHDWCALPYGILQAPAGSGKTLIGAALIGKYGVRSVVIVPTVDILNQWCESIESRFGVKPGRLGGGAEYKGEMITVATFQSAIKCPHMLRDAGLVLIDECHRAPCRSIRDVLALTPAAYRYGCTATPERADGLTEALTWLLGGVTASIARDDVGDYLLDPDVICINTGETFYGSHGDVQGEIPCNANRNALISCRIADLARSGRRILALAVRKEHIRVMRILLKSKGVSYAMVDAFTNTKKRERIIEDMRRGNKSVLLATYQLAGEGLDIPALDTLVMLAPIGNPPKVEQVCGRVARLYEGKGIPEVYDFIDEGPMCGALSVRRHRVYVSLKWRVRYGN